MFPPPQLTPGSWETSPSRISGATGVVSLLLKQVAFCKPNLQSETERNLYLQGILGDKGDLQCQGRYLSCRLGDALIRSG